MSAAETAIENMEKAMALPCIAPGGTAVCPEGRIRIGVFFDGTGNNMLRDWYNPFITEPQNGAKLGAPTNVAKLWMIYAADDVLVKRVYHHGVGSDSDSPDDGTTDKAPDWSGLGAGEGSRARVNWGLEMLNEFFNQGTNAFAAEKLVDTYGFSRGAAIARDFINRVKMVGIEDRRNGMTEFKWVEMEDITGTVPVRIPAYPRFTDITMTFAGLFDTVASMGAGGLEVGNILTGFTFYLNHNWVQRTVHFIAEDEIRMNFPLHSIGMDPNNTRKFEPLPTGVMVEIPYRGAHSDIGGGYIWQPAKPGKPEQVITAGGRGGVYTTVIPAEPDRPPLRPQLSHIPLRDMWKASVQAGVPLKPLTDLGDSRLYEVPADLEESYAAYDAYREGQPYAVSKRYLQGFPTSEYQSMYYDQRDAQEHIRYLKSHFLHDSRWWMDKPVPRQKRTVHYMPRQLEKE